MTPLSPLGLAALTLATEYGLAIFPIAQRAKKPPLCEHGFHDASTYPEQIAEWWGGTPDANIGAVPGSIDCVVIDTDGLTGEALARTLGVLDTPTCCTVTGRGAHYWFRLPRGVLIVGNIARTQLDVRSSLGYVLVPPSTHPNGSRYEWRGSLDAIADAPHELLAWLVRATVGAGTVARTIPRAPQVLDDRASHRVMAYAARIGYALSDGRKCAAFRFSAFLLHDCRLGAGGALRFLETWNSYNVPPLSARLLGVIHANAQRFGGRSAA